MLTVYYLKGLPGSGKSTWAKEKLKSFGPNVAKRVNKDELRAMLDDSQWSRGNESFVVDIEHKIAEAALAAGKHVIVDNTGFAQVHINRYTELSKKYAAYFEIVDFTHVPLEECIKRDLKRLNSVGESVIRGMHQEYIQAKIIPPDHDPSLCNAVICDLDGTLCDLNGRNPYDGASCGQDKLRTHVRFALSGLLIAKDVVPIFMSGRSDVHRPQTESWLIDVAALNPAHLFMRKDGDTRRDSIVKRELFEENVRGKFNVVAIIDDRPQVIRECWRALGFADRILDVGTGKDF